MSFVLRVGTLALAWLLIGPVTPAWSGAPTDQLRGSIDRVLAIVNDPALQAPARAAERNAALRAALEARVDAARAARETLGLYWRDRTPQEQEQFTGLFRELLERTYMARIKAHAASEKTLAEAASRLDLGSLISVKRGRGGCCHRGPSFP